VRTQEGDGKESSDPFFAAQMAGYLILNQVSSARFLWKRLPKSVAARSEDLKALWRVGQALWKRDRAEALQQLAAARWSPRIEPLVAELERRTRENAFQLIALAYSAISAAACARMVALSADQCAAEVAKRGWRVEGAHIVPVRPPQPAESPSEPRLLKELAEYSFELER
jgi:COP9 signalosome complex subunit 8